MKQLVILIEDDSLIKTVLDLAINLGLSVDKDQYNRTKDEAISIGTSKKYVVAGNNNFDFYQRKYPNIKTVNLIRENISLMTIFECLLNNASISSPAKELTKEIIDKVVKTTEKKQAKDKKVKGVPISIVTSLYTKVKGNKKSPSNYFVKIKNNEYIASSKEEDSLGNLQDLFELI
jgi:hypothetical protein